jgi:hypothetical protein
VHLTRNDKDTKRVAAGLEEREYTRVGGKGNPSGGGKKIQQGGHRQRREETNTEYRRGDGAAAEVTESLEKTSGVERTRRWEWQESFRNGSFPLGIEKTLTFSLREGRDET